MRSESGNLSCAFTYRLIQQVNHAKRLKWKKIMQQARSLLQFIIKRHDSIYKALSNNELRLE